MPYFILRQSMTLLVVIDQFLTGGEMALASALVADVGSIGEVDVG